jgi:hypothetical protein
LLLELQTEIEALNTTITQQQNIINNLNSTITELQNNNTELENRVSVLETLNGLRINWSNGLVGYWKFDEGNGSTVYDSSSQANNGTVYGASWISDTINGKDGTALSFDGTDDYVAIPDLYSSSPSELTVSAWINSSLITTWWRGDSIIHHCRNGEFGLQLVYSGVICFNAKAAGGSGRDVRWTPSPNEWHQIVGTWKKGDSVKLYVDGTLVNQTAVADEYMYNAYWLDAAIGSLYRSEAFFNGTIDEVMVYNRTLSAQEVMAHYLLPPP